MPAAFVIRGQVYRDDEGDSVEEIRDPDSGPDRADVVIRWIVARLSYRMTAIGLVLGAGAASRFGATKQVANFAGRPLISFPIQALRGAGLEQVLIVLGANSEHVVPHLRGEEVVFNPEWRDGLSTSLRAGLEAAAARGADRVVVALADQPLLSSQAVARVLEASNRGAQIARATYFGNAGHPIALAQDTFGAAAR